jgi:Fur family transcriptional regulator, ferric uptake regulator
MRNPSLNHAGKPVTASPALLSPVERARSMIRATGARMTAARARVLAELLQCGEALTHLDLQKRVGSGSEPIDRVTLYRVLDWLAESGLAHRVAGPDRVFRFSVHATEVPHGHFKCVDCGRMYCLTEVERFERRVRDMLPEGFTGARIELTVSGRCAASAREH